MARKITTLAINAFMSAREFSLDNTKIEVVTERFCTEIPGDTRPAILLKLHGHVIARRYIGSNDIQITNAGWFSNTTKERLNGIPGVSICQKKGQWFLNGNAWNGEWTTI